MSKTLEWHILDDEHTEWRAERPARRVRPSYRRWSLLGAVALVAATIIIWRLAERRVHVSTEWMGAGVRTSHELAQRAAGSSDAELLGTVLSGRDQRWTETQRQLVKNGYSYTAAPRLLFLEPAGEPEERALTLDPELRTAELVLTQLYTPTALSTVTELVAFEQTYVYRRGRNGWLLSPPDGGYWGVQRSTLAGRVVVNYPERDEELALRLAWSLGEDVEALCALQADGCPAELIVTVTLAPDPASLLHFASGELMLRSGMTTILPSPSLLGVPQDHGAYQALHEAYARYVLTALSAELFNWTGYEHVLFYQVLLQAQLHDLGLAPPLLASADSVAALDLVSDARRFFGDLSQNWQSQRPIGLHTPLPLELRILVAFLLANDQSAGQAQLSLNQPADLHRWWSSFATFAPTGQLDVRLHLISFVQAHYAPAPLPAGLALPGDDLRLVCGEKHRSSWWRYIFAAETWTEEPAPEEGRFATGILSPGGENELATGARSGQLQLFLRPRGGEWRQLPVQGFSPFWLDDHTFAYFEKAGAPSEPLCASDFRLVVQTVDHESTVLVAATTAGSRGEQDLRVHYTGGLYSAASDTVYLIATNENERCWCYAPAPSTSLLAVIRPANGSWLVDQPLAPAVVATIEGCPSGLPFSSYGRWMLLLLNSPRRQYPLLWLVDLRGEESPWLGTTTSDWPSPAWSSDGQWLAWLAEGAIRLVAPGHRDASGEPYQLLIPIPDDKEHCSSLDWRER